MAQHQYQQQQQQQTQQYQYQPISQFHSPGVDYGHSLVATGATAYWYPGAGQYPDTHQAQNASSSFASGSGRTRTSRPYSRDSQNEQFSSRNAFVTSPNRVSRYVQRVVRC